MVALTKKHITNKFSLQMMSSSILIYYSISQSHVIQQIRSEHLKMYTKRWKTIKTHKENCLYRLMHHDDDVDRIFLWGDALSYTAGLLSNQPCSKGFSTKAQRCISVQNTGKVLAWTRKSAYFYNVKRNSTARVCITKTANSGNQLQASWLPGW